ELSLTQAGAVVGTPAYVAPEQLAGGPIDPRSDLFGLGCTLYRMTAGKTPVPHGTPGAMRPGAADRGILPPRDANPDVPTELSDFILQLLASDLARRPQSARLVAERLAEVGARLCHARAAPLTSAPAELSGASVRRRNVAL